MSRILRLNKTLNLLQDISINKHSVIYLWKRQAKIHICNKCLLIPSLTGRGFSCSTSRLSNGSTEVKFNITPLGRHHGHRQRKKYSDVSLRRKVEIDLFKLLNARTTQLALEAVLRDSGDTFSTTTTSAILVFPRSAKVFEAIERHRDRTAVPESAKNENSHPQNFATSQSLLDDQLSSESRSANSSHRHHLHSLVQVQHGAESGSWESSVDVFHGQFAHQESSANKDDVSRDVNDIDFLDSWLSADAKDVSFHRDGPEHDKLQEFGSEKGDKNHIASANRLMSIPGLSDELPHKPSAKLPDFLETKKSAVSVNANILKHKQSVKRTDKSATSSMKPIASEMLEDVFHEPMLEDEEGHSIKADFGVVEALKPKSKKQKKLSKAEKKKLEKESERHVNPEKWTKVFNHDLAAYVEACCSTGLMANAHSTIRFFHFNKQNNSAMRNIQNVNIYNTLMHGWAKQGEISKVKELFALVKRDGLKPTLQTYAACLECLQHGEEFDVSLGRRMIQDLEKEGLDLRNIFAECTFKKGERDSVLKAIEELKPDFEPHPTPVVEPYSGPLLEQLNQPLPPDQVVEMNPYAGVISREDMTNQLKRQLQREIEGTVTVKSIARKPETTKKMKEYRERLEAVREEWREMCKKGFNKKLRYHSRKKKGEHGLTLFPYLKVLTAEDYVECMMQEVEKIGMSSGTFSPSLSYLWKQIGIRICNKYIMQQRIKNEIPYKISQLYRQFTDHYNDEVFGFTNHRVCWQHLLASDTDGTALDTPEKLWPHHILKGVGKIFFDILLYDVKIDANALKTTEERKMVPAFYTMYRTYANRTVEEIKPNPVLIRLYQGAALDDLKFDATDLPMLVSPKPWISMNYGGFLVGTNRLIRLPDQAQNQLERLERLPPRNIHAVLDSLNSLGACAWVINKPMLDLLIGIFNNKGMKLLDIPPPVSECPPMPKMTSDMTSKQKSKVFRERTKIRQMKSEMYSLWCSELYRLSIANMFRDSVFWFPHNMDFRGRTYPCPPHFNHLGSDVARGILQFAKGKPLGKKGLDWLKIHLVNLTGFKKRTSNADRLAYANEIMPKILDSADNPLTGGKWWQDSDEPWQTLACCKEIANAVRSSDPSQFISHMPVHQDGSCNGLQHYAALGRDEAGGKSVNLCPFSIPQDVYSNVSELVEKARQRDAEDNVKVAQLLEGFVRRKVIKQTVMTTVYGVTRYGAKYQILRQLKDIPEFPQEHVWTASAYLTEKTFQCLREMFTATREIQDWLTVSAQVISTIRHKPVEWITPLGLLVIQPYHKQQSLSRFGIRVTDHWNNLEKPNSLKQKNGFPPNFIHSLDSTHMMLTSLYCLRAGITYVSVHDCYWTHAADVPVMNKICREQFVSLHTQPILEDLSRYLLKQFSNQENVHNSEDVKRAEEILHSVLSKVPARGDLDLNSVLSSTYFFG